MPTVISPVYPESIRGLHAHVSMIHAHAPIFPHFLKTRYRTLEGLEGLEAFLFASFGEPTPKAFGGDATPKVARRARHEERRTNMVKNALGDFLIKLERRVDEINSTGPIPYVQQCGGQFDETSKKLIDEIENYLKEWCGPAKAALFKSTTGLTYTEKREFHPTRPFHFIFDRSRLGTIPRHDWQATKDALAHWAAQLKEIIKNLD